MPYRRLAAPLRRAGLATVCAVATLLTATGAARPGVPRPAPPPVPRPLAPMPAQPPRTGAQVYASVCAACHQSSGEGNGETYPPLAGSSWVTGNEQRLVLVILHGLTGEIDVEGQTFAGVMPPWGPTLKDEEIAAVATYVRSSWGNKAAAVRPATVTQLRAAHPARTAPWTAAELARAAGASGQ